MTVRGQYGTMRTSYIGLIGGLGFAIILVYLLIVVNFQSWLDPFIIITALPAALAGIVLFLFITHTTLSVPALMGAIMCMGVATANSILVVSFAKERLLHHGDSLIGRNRSRHHALPPRHHDGLGHDHRHDSDGAWPRATAVSKMRPWAAPSSAACSAPQWPRWSLSPRCLPCCTAGATSPEAQRGCRAGKRTDSRVIATQANGDMT